MDKDQVNADIASKLLNLKKSYVGEYNAEILSGKYLNLVIKKEKDYYLNCLF